MNRNIEVINENLWAVNMHYAKAGYIKEIPIKPGTESRNDQIWLSDCGVIILDNNSRAYPVLKKLFLWCMEKSDEELQELLKKSKSDSLDGLCENVVGWEIKRRCVKAEYLSSQPKPTFKDKIIMWIRKKVKEWRVFKQG